MKKVQSDENSPAQSALERGLNYARWGGYLFSSLLIILAINEFRTLSAESSGFTLF